MYKKFSIIILLLVGMMFSTKIFAGDKENCDEWTLDKSIDYALSNSKELDIENINIEKAEVLHKEMKKKIDDFNKAKDFIRIDSMEVYLMIKNVPKLQDELRLDIAKKNKNIKINQIKYDVEKIFYNAFHAQEQLRISKDSLELCKEQYKHSKKMFDVGSISKQQLLEMQVSLSNAESSSCNTNMAYELVLMQFKNIIGLNLDEKVILICDQINQEPEENRNLSELIKNAIDNNATVYMMNKNLEISKKTLDAVKIGYPEITYRYKEQFANVKKTEMQLKIAKDNVEIGVRKAVLEMETAQKMIKSYDTAVKNAQLAYNLSRLSYELGQGKSTDVDMALINLDQAKLNLLRKKYDYMVAMLDFKYSLGLGKIQLPTGM